MMSKIKPKIAIGSQLLNALVSLPHGTLKKAKDTIQKFKDNPESPGLNYETINGCKDRRLHSIRVDQNYRGIVLKQEGGSSYIFLWIDKHDEAYAWAIRHQIGVNRQTGNIEVVDTVASESAAAPREIEEVIREDNRPDIFLPFTDKDLHQLGASDEHIPLIRSIKELNDVEKLERRLPRLLFDGLYMLALGDPFSQVLDELGIVAKDADAYDPDDFGSVLELPTNQYEFATLTDDAELESMLNEPMAKWRVFLHSSQRKLVHTDFNGPVRVLGGAGTGKTVVAMHRAKRLAGLCHQSQKVFFTTFTKSLVSDIQDNLRKICSFEEIKRIDVENLDKWSQRFLRDNGYDRRVVYQREDALWDRAMQLEESGEWTSDFVYDEWTRVVQYHDVESMAEYLRVPRVGRKGRLSRIQRMKLWPVFEEYRKLLEEHKIWEQVDVYRNARQLLDSGKSARPFRYLIVDEIQDFHPQAFRLFRAMVTDNSGQNDLFLVGDGSQNIYGHHVVLSKTGINIRGRGKKLRINYRTPEQVRNWATSVLTGVEISDLDGGLDDSKGYRSLLKGSDPVFKAHRSRNEEIETIVQWIQEVRQCHPNHVVCVCVYTNKLREVYGEALKAKGIDVHQIDSDHHDIEDPLPIRMITMHRIKGLEFDEVCLAGCSARNIQRKTMETKCLIHVAATRTKNSLLVTSDGEMCEVLHL